MLNWIWLGFLLVAVIVGGFTGRFPEMTKGAFQSAETAVMSFALPLIGLWAIWLGMMRLAERSGLVRIMARMLRPLLRMLFPQVPAEHPAMGAMVLNIAANMLGLGNAATPLGLRAMAQLERINPHPGVASDAMCTFLALNTASIQVIPTTAIGILAVAHSSNPTCIVPAAIIATTIAACAGVTAAKFFARWKMFRLAPAAAIEGQEIEPEEALVEEPLALGTGGRVAVVLFFALFAAFFALLLWPGVMGGAFQHPTVPTAGAADGAAIHPHAIGLRILDAISILAIPFLLSFFPFFAALHRIKVYDEFVEGAREAFITAQRVIPYLVGMLVSISLLRNAGVIDLLTDALRPLFNLFRFPAELLPMVLLRPLSGSATQGVFVELIHNPSIGPDSLIGRTAATIYGSTETTFYVLAVYFGSVGIRRTRHAVLVGLVADGVAVAASVAVCRYLFA